MDTVKEKLSDEELKTQADEARANSARLRALMLGSIETLLAGADILSSDLIRNLRDEKVSLCGGMQSQQIEQEDRAAALDMSEAGVTIEAIERVLSGWIPVKRAAILEHILDGMPDKEDEYIADVGANEAEEALLNYISHNRTTEERKVFYEKLLAGVKDGKGIVELKATR